MDKIGEGDTGTSYQYRSKTGCDDNRQIVEIKRPYNCATSIQSRVRVALWSHPQHSDVDDQSRRPAYHFLRSQLPPIHAIDR
jgi:hypothetical protein